MMRPEEKLLLLALRYGVNDRAGEDMTVLPGRPIDWPRLVEMASGHGVMPLLYRAFRKNYAHLVPREILSQFRLAYQNNTAWNLLLTAELQKIVNRLESNGIPCIPYKGPALAAQLYGDIALRQFGDLDILVRRRDVLKSRDLIAAMGYEATTDLEGAQALAFKEGMVHLAEGVARAWPILGRRRSAEEARSIRFISDQLGLRGRRDVEAGPAPRRTRAAA